MRDEVADGWKISQVEALVGLPRRDIQRACYEGAGGLGIVKPRNTTWGWRVYEVPDVAKLFLLAQGRRQGKMLDEVRDDLASCEGARDVSHKLARCEQAACEACDAQAGASMSARALRCAIEQGDVTVFAGLIDASFAEDARAFCDAHAALGLAAEGLLEPTIPPTLRSPRISPSFARAVKLRVRMMRRRFAQLQCMRFPSGARCAPPMRPSCLLGR